MTKHTTLQWKIKYALYLIQQTRLAILTQTMSNANTLLSCCGCALFYYTHRHYLYRIWSTIKKKRKKNVSLNYSFAIIHSISRENNIILTISYLKRGGRVERKSNVKAEIFFFGSKCFFGSMVKMLRQRWLTYLVLALPI